MNQIKLNKLISTENIKAIAQQLSVEETYVLLLLGDAEVVFSPLALERMIQIAEDSGAGLLYSDYTVFENKQKTNIPLCDYQSGSLRDDFDFGHILLIKTAVLKQAVISMNSNYRFAGLYDLRLKIAENHSIIHINEYLYSIHKTETISSEEKQFAYVDPKNKDVQIEMEAVCTQYLKNIGAYLEPQFKEVAFNEDNFAYEASVIIPVRNRVNTIEDAILSVLQQETTFPYNLIIVDNHSTDGTSEIISKYVQDKRVIHLIPSTNDLNIGGCWNLAVHHHQCGKFAIQLDSDDLYAHNQVLQTIVDAFYQQQCAMVVGTYKMVNFKLEEIPPGIIDHREWTPENGRNNALRINGLGAPRAFYTPVLRKLNLPNTSYGEDYAIGLRISREYQIGRIYDVLYLCRRWEGNSDASVSIEKMNGFNTYKDRLRTWEIAARKALSFGVCNVVGNHFDQREKPLEGLEGEISELFEDQLTNWKLAKDNYAALSHVQTRKISFDGFDIVIQFNPERVRSTCAGRPIPDKSHSSCFLCKENLPKEQKGIPFENDFTILCNPYPVFSKHLTIASNKHIPQTIVGNIPVMLRLSKLLPEFVVFYNGPECGASAPMHLHFQAVPKQEFPLYNDFALLAPTLSAPQLIKDGLRVFRVLTSDNPEELTALFDSQYNKGKEPNVNILVWFENNRWTICIFERKQHRPSQFYAEGEEHLLVSPAAVEMAGLLITPRLADFEKISKDDLRNIYEQVNGER